jgi:Ca-activated chloride channel family protein
MLEQSLEGFHFLRPWWLLLLPLALWLYWHLRRVISAADQWREIIDPDLLKVLVIGGGRARRFRPYQLLTGVIILTGLALAGPAWQRELTPFTEDRAPLIVALELTESMDGIDQPPDRLQRARQKIRDLLALRQGARTAVIVYAGSAHAVLPLTDDSALIELYLAALTREVMPLPGDRPDKALALARKMLDRESEAVSGTILFMSDGIDRSFSTLFEAAFESTKDQLLILGFGTEEGGPVAAGPGQAPPIDLGGLESTAAAAGGWFTRATVDESDVASLNRRIQRHLVNAIENDESLQWLDAGYVLVWPLALLMLAWFRRGWTVQWR